MQEREGKGVRKCLPFQRPPSFLLPPPKSWLQTAPSLPTVPAVASCLKT